MEGEQQSKKRSFREKIAFIIPMNFSKTKWTILILGYIAIAAVSIFAIHTASADFREVKWGDDIATVKEKEVELGSELYKETDQGDSILLIYDVYVDSKPAELYYYFCKSEALDSSEYLLCEAHYIIDDSECTCKSLEATLESVYGEPTDTISDSFSDIWIWNNKRTEIKLTNFDDYYRIDYGLIDYLNSAGHVDTGL